ncbi:hypothetical protein [Tropicibacter alexandrii]|uniref:hypothetical protein n=1 Tax=Tropicibacter alexandrii TaxID=2267683 RepID=UPI001F0BB55A|nr:hypothetical protein [Tropicibacter alexandrii]
MKKIVCGMAALAVTAGCVMAPKDVTEADLANFDAAVASIGCDLVGESDYLPVELQTGLPREKVVEVAQYRVAQEQAVGLENGGVRLITGACAPKDV